MPSADKGLRPIAGGADFVVDVPAPLATVERHPLTGLTRGRCDCAVCGGRGTYGRLWTGEPFERRRRPRHGR